MAQTQLAAAGVPNPAVDAELLYRYLFALDKMDFFREWSQSLDDENCERYLNLVAVRAGGKPLQYITGEQEFMGHSFRVDERVLIPRPETELLTEKVIEVAESIRRPHVLDLCTGSGCIAVSVALAVKAAAVTASDISSDALDLAEENAENLGADVSFVSGDLLAPFTKGIFKKTFDIIVTNPPYIPSAVIPTLGVEVREHEPVLALDGGADGLDFYRRIIKDAGRCLKKGGILLMEIGSEQADAIRALAAENGYVSCGIAKDYAGLDRIAALKP